MKQQSWVSTGVRTPEMSEIAHGARMLSRTAGHTNNSNQRTSKLYADDMKLHSDIKTGIECSKLQDGLNKLYESSDKT